MVQNLPRAKRERLLAHHQVVKPAFITDSVAAGYLLDWRKYSHFDGLTGKGTTEGTRETFGHDDLIRGYLSRPADLENFDFSVPDRPGKDVLDVDLKKYLKDSKLPESWAIFNNPKKSIGEFYVNSRLHWLSTWRMELADMVCALPRRNFKKFNGQKGKFFSKFERQLSPIFFISENFQIWVEIE